jgi:hypothetical protein
MTLLDREEHFTKRQEAQQRRDVKVREAAAQYEADKADDDRLFNAVFDAIREQCRRDWEAAKQRPKPTYEAAKAKMDAAVADADRQLEAELREAFLKIGTTDNHQT